MTKLDLRIRPSSEADAEWATALYNAANPDNAHDVPFTTWMWALRDDDWKEERYAFESEGRPLAWATVEHVVWSKNQERFADAEAWVDPMHNSAERVDWIYGFLEARAAALGSRHLTASLREDDHVTLAALAGRRYVEKGRQRYWELDLVKNREAVLEAAQSTLLGATNKGFHIGLLAGDDSPNLETELFENHEEGRRDVPRSTPFVTWSRSLFSEWLHDPRKRADRFWIARRGDELAGMSVLAYPVTAVGAVSTAWTGVARKFRGQGLARALKLQTLVQAIGLGVTSVRTDNDSGNAPILHLNADMGYAEVPGHVKLQLDLPI